MHNISVIIPAYNIEKYIDKCLDSVVAQDGVDMEVICVDDGSTDKTVKILKDYADRDARIKVYSKKNEGLSSARNYGFDKACGEYVYFLDGDDRLVSSEDIAYIYNIMRSSNLDVLHFDGKVRVEEGFEKEDFNKDAYRQKKSLGHFDTGRDLFCDMVLEGNYSPVVSLQAFRSRFLRENNLQFEYGRLFEDKLFSFQVALCAEKVEHTNRVMLEKLVRDQSIMHSQISEKKLRDYMHVLCETIKLWLSIEVDDRLNEAVSYRVNGTISVLTSMYMSSDKEMRIKVFREFPSFERRLIDYAVSNRIKEKPASGERIPYHLFRRNEKVLIYGAGQRGKVYYRRARNDAYIHAVGIVDKKAKDMLEDDVPVQPVEKIVDIQYDSILISPADKTVYKEIYTYLISVGINKSKIKWDGNRYWDKDFYRRCYEESKFAKRNIKSCYPKIIKFGLPEHGNLGDYLIGYAEDEFLNNYFHGKYVVRVTQEEWKALKYSIIDMVGDRDLILLQGGGNFGDLYSSGAAFREICDTFSDNPIVYLPNNLTYREDMVDNMVLKDHISWLSHRENVYIFWRTSDSFKICGNSLKRSFYAPDMSFYLLCINYFNQDNKTASTKSGIAVCLRNDDESTANHAELVRGILNRESLNWFLIDTHKHMYVSYEEGMEQIIAIIDKISKASLVITDRLHCMIMSIIAGTRCIAIDNSTHKLTGMKEWICEIDADVEFLDSVDEKAILRVVHSKSDENRELKTDIIINRYGEMFRIISDFWSKYKGEL